MRKYEDDQVQSVMLQGKDAQMLSSYRQEMDLAAEKICQELNSAFNRAEEQFKQLGYEYEPKFSKLFEGTDLQGVPVGQIGIDFSKSEQHGIVFAKKIERSPIEVFLETLRSATKDHVGPGSDSIIIESGGPDLAKAWGTQREPEHA